MIFFFDTETTGLPNFKSDDPFGQPYVVQLGGLLCDEDGREEACIDLLIKPNSWTVPDEVAKIHGVTTKRATKFGIPIATAINCFSQLVNQAQVVVAHNIQFDIRLMSYEYKRLQAPQAMTAMGMFLGKPRCCTMEHTTNICQLPGKYGKYKWPKLIEAYRHIFGREFENAHNAMADVRACKEVYFELKKRGVIQ